MRAFYQVVAVVVLGLLVSTLLQGCGANKMAAAGMCADMTVDGGKINGAESYDKPKVDCKDDSLEYSGPELQCNWVGLKCSKKKDTDEKTCGAVWGFGEKGKGLKEWPETKEPEWVKTADDLPEGSRIWTSKKSGKEFADEAKDWAGKSWKKSLMAAANKAKQQAKERAAKLKEKGNDLVPTTAPKEEKKRRLAAAPLPTPVKKLQCSAPKEAKEDGKDESKDDDKSKATTTKAPAKAKLYSVNAQQATPADTGSGWVMPLTGCLAVAGVAFAVLKIARAPSARSRALDAHQQDEESSQEAIE